MDFDNNKPIYFQICEGIYEKILSGKYNPGDRIPSVREYGAEMGVNPNTVARSYEKLTDSGIIHNKRGIGFYISDNAKNIVLAAQRKAFMEEEVPQFLKKLKLLNIDIKELIK